MAQEEVNIQDEPSEEKTYDLSVFADQIEMFKDKLDDDVINSHIINHLKKILTTCWGIFA